MVANKTATVSRRLGVIIALALLLATPNSLVPLTEASIGIANHRSYVDHGFAAMDASERVTQGFLEKGTNGNLSTGALAGVIQSQLLPLNVREVLLDIGWENFSVGKPPYQAWVANWLSACDALGVKNVFYVGQLTREGFGSPWVKSLLKLDPSVATYYSGGLQAEYVSLDNPEVARYLETDLSSLYSQYGSHPSWVGLGTGSSSGDPYYATPGAFPEVGYSNLSISSFFNSHYYQADINGTGYLPNGKLDALWNEFRSTPAIVMSSGLWMTSTSYTVYGSGSSASFIEMRFEIPTNVTSLQLLWYGYVVGSPGSLVVTVFGDNGGGLDTNREIASSNTSASAFSGSRGWQGGTLVNGNLSAGWYWVKFSSPSSTTSNYYNFYLKDYSVNNATAYAAQAAIGPGFQHGSTVLWLKDRSGKDIAIYPYQQAAVGAPTQFITATHVFSFNTVLLFLSDRAYNTANATITVTDTTDGSRVVATGVLSQAFVRGLENWVPIALSRAVTTKLHHVYTLTISDPSVTWITITRYVTTDPPRAGFQNESACLLFELAYVKWSQGLSNWGGMTSNGGSPITTGILDAVRFKPTISGSIKSVQILMYGGQGGPNYTSGSVGVGIWKSQTDGSAPLGPPMKEISIPAYDVPRNGFLNTSKFDVSVRSGSYYWVVFSANSTDRFTFARLTNPFEFLVLTSSNGGKTWYNPSDGPTEYAFTIALSGQTLGTYVSGTVGVDLTQNSLFAQPFVTSSDVSIDGLHIGPLIPGPHLLVSINPTGASGMPTVTPLGFGVYNAGNITLDYGPEFVQFTSVANLQKGVKYWIVIRPTGDYHINMLTYLPSTPDIPSNSSAVVSTNGGLSWSRISSKTALISEYLLETPPVESPRYNTSALFNDLSSNHNFPVSSGPLHGWNAYVQASELSMYSQVAQWLNTFSGRSYEFYANTVANVLDHLGLPFVVSLPTKGSPSDCQEYEGNLESAISTGTGPLFYASVSALRRCASAGISNLSDQLGYVPYVGDLSGQNTPDRVLVVGGQGAANLSRYLSNAFHTTYLNYTMDPSFLHRVNLPSFTAILWDVTGETLATSTVHSLVSYARNGGQLLTMDPPLYNASSVIVSVPGLRSPVLGESAFLRNALVHTGLSIGQVQLSLTNSSFVARTPTLTISVREVGAGKIILLSSNVESAPQVSDESVVLLDIVSGALGIQPPLWYTTSGLKAEQDITFSISGGLGSSLLVSVYNSGNSSYPFTLSLNGSHYGIPSTWKAVEIPDLNVTIGSGSNVIVHTSVPGRELTSVILISNKKPLIDYSSGTITRQLPYPDQALYSITGTLSQTVLSMISTNRSAGQVALNDQTSLPQLPSASRLYQAASGWYFDNASESLFVKYQSTGVDNLRYYFYAPPTPRPAVLPEQYLLIALAALVTIEVGSYSLSLLRGQRRRPAGN